MKHLVICGVLIVAITLFGVSCGNKKENDVSSITEKTELKFYIWSDEENYMTEVVDNYNTSQDTVTVELISIPNETYDDKLRVMLSAGSDADIVDIRTMDQMLQYQKAGALYDLTDMVKSSNLDVSNYGAFWDLTYQDGVVPALPTRTTCWMLFYNADMFQEAGIIMPEQLTWNQYRTIAKQLTSGDGSQYGGCWVDWYMYQSLATQKGTHIIDDDLTDVREAIQFINDLLNTDASHTPIAELKSNDSQYLADFENGRTAMLINGEWLINMLRSDAETGKTDVNWEVAPMPVAHNMEPGTTWGSFQFAGIPSTAKHPDASFDFLEYLCGDGGASVLPKYGMLPAYSNSTAQVAFDQAVGKESASKVIFNAKQMPEKPSYDRYHEVLMAFTEHAELYFNGEKDLDTTMKNFERQRTQIMK